MRKVLATSKGGRALVAFGWVNVRICDGAGVKAATVCALDLRAEIRADPDLMDFVDLNYYGPPTPVGQPKPYSERVNWRGPR